MTHFTNYSHEIAPEASKPLSDGSLQAVGGAPGLHGMIAEAKAIVPSISPEELKIILAQDDVLVVDVRDAPELIETGKVLGALNVSRGMLEFRADEAAPFHNKAFTKDKTIVLYCASGGRSALAGKALMDLGFQDVRSLGAFKDWVEAGGAVEKPSFPIRIEE